LVSKALRPWLVTETPRRERGGDEGRLPAGAQRVGMDVQVSTQRWVRFRHGGKTGLDETLSHRPVPVHA